LQEPAITGVRRAGLSRCSGEFCHHHIVRRISFPF
jgi:hypothetical protein